MLRGNLVVRFLPILKRVLGRAEKRREEKRREENLEQLDGFPIPSRRSLRAVYVTAFLPTEAMMETERNSARYRFSQCRIITSDSFAV